MRVCADVMTQVLRACTAHVKKPSLDFRMSKEANDTCESSSRASGDFGHFKHGDYEDSIELEHGKKRWNFSQ